LKKKIISPRKNCILCNSKNVRNVINFGKTPLANSYPTSIRKKENYYRLALLLCKSCGHLQLKDIFDTKTMFESYVYVSGTSLVLRQHFENYAKKIIKKFRIIPKDKILDIACNDGTFLEYFVKKKFKNVVGIDPAKNLRLINKRKKIDINTFFFNKKTSQLIKKKYNNFKIITANNVCAHTPDLNDFFTGIKNLLDPKGVFVFEVSYLLDVYRKLTFDTIYHEHMSYHSLMPLIEFVNNKNLEIIDFERIEAQGGSIRIYVAHPNVFNKKINKIKRQINIEKRNKLFTDATYYRYFFKIKKTKKILKKTLNRFKSKKFRIIGYGAPAKLTTFSHVMGIKGNDLEYIIDDNPLKQNKFAPGTKIPIFDITKLQTDRPDVILVLAWNFFESIHKKCKRLLKSNTIFIKPFPKIKIY
jgi:cyclopropane fatty-acyl-phospholipid synthase-like methyltransferase|tara:strand:+ start:2391 stop:3635 length:1245 start_codon:yes stop_codon:yes gene_type:complete